MNAPLASFPAVVLAGGFGTRIRHLAPGVPKPMITVGGRPFLEWVVRYLVKQGVHEIILSTGHLAEVVEKYFAAHPIPGASVTCVPETTPLGTAGGFLNCLPAAKQASSAWLVLNGDSLALAPLAPLVQCLAAPEISGGILGVRVPDASRYGSIARAADGDLTGFREKQPGGGDINAGVYLFRAALIRQFPARTPLSFELDVFPALLAQGVRLKVSVTASPFLDIGTPETLALAEAFVRQNQNYFQS